MTNLECENPRQEVGSIFDGERVAFIGRLGGLNRKEAASLIRNHGGHPVDVSDDRTTLVVIGADELVQDSADSLLNDPIRSRVAAGECRTWSETRLWQELGLVEQESHVRRLYTPAMLAELLSVSVSTVRRWHRRGLISPAREVHRLPYFDFQEVTNARQIAQLVAAGTSPKHIENKLVQLSQFITEASRPLAQLSVIVQGRDVLLRQGEGLVDSGGQLRIDFEAYEPASDDSSEEIVLLKPGKLLDPSARVGGDLPTPEELLEQSARLEEEGRLDESAEALRSWLIAGGPSPEVNFQLAEILYRLGDLSAARERYFVAIELDDNYVEARANLGCLLAEQGDYELAIAAFRGALRFHSDYPDVHFHLGRLFDDLNRQDEALPYWQRFVELAPDSPWADEARARLGLELMARDEEPV